jgi:hypothetical protein
MSPSLIGLAIGLLLGGISYGMLKKLGTRVDKPETRTLLNTVALIELVTLPVFGYLIGAFVFE